jgi:hypothetical protein
MSQVPRRFKELSRSGFDAYLDLLCSNPEEMAGRADLLRVTLGSFSHAKTTADFYIES